MRLCAAGGVRRAPGARAQCVRSGGHRLHGVRAGGRLYAAHHGARALRGNGGRAGAPVSVRGENALSPRPAAAAAARRALPGRVRGAARGGAGGADIVAVHLAHRCDRQRDAHDRADPALSGRMRRAPGHVLARAVERPGAQRHDSAPAGAALADRERARQPRRGAKKTPCRTSRRTTRP